MLWTVIINLFLTIFFNQAPRLAAVNADAVVIARRIEIMPIEILAEKGAVLAADDHFFLFEKRADEVQPIASITKLMTALVFLDNNPGWEKTYMITADDKVEGGRLNLFPGDEVTLKDLFYTSLVASDNGAALALARATGLSEMEFVIKMNEEAKKLGLTKTHFADPVGLSEYNVSTARETAFLAQAAFARSEIKEATASREYNFITLNGREKKIESTDYLLFDPALDPVVSSSLNYSSDFSPNFSPGPSPGSSPNSSFNYSPDSSSISSPNSSSDYSADSSPDFLQILAGKTGYTDQAGYCFVGKLRGPGGREVISVVLNSAGKNERFKESKNLVNWVFSGYDWGRP